MNIQADREERLREVAPILKTIDESWSILIHGKCHRARLVTQYGSAGLILRPDRLYPKFSMANIGLCGTQMSAIAQIENWLKDWPRRPMECWKAWVAAGLGSARTLELLSERELYT